MPKNTLEFPALRARQGKWDIFVFVIKSTTLDKIACVTRRIADKNEGYQRSLNENRANDIATYIDKDKGCLPTSVLLNLECDCSYDEKKGTLSIPNKEDVALVIDGQHRMYGMRKASNKIEIVVTAFKNLDIASQAKQFKVINSKQKGVPSSLLYDLLDLTKDGTFVETRGHELTVRLNESADSPLKNLIDMLGVKLPGTLVLQTRVIDSLDPLINERGALFQYTEEEQYGILRNYFQAVRELLPSEWLNKKSILCKAIGFSSMLIILPQVLTQTIQKHNNFKVASIKDILKPLKDYDFDSEKHKGLAGNPGQNAIAAKLAEQLKNYKQPNSTGKPTIIL